MMTISALSTGLNYECTRVSSKSSTRVFLPFLPGGCSGKRYESLACWDYGTSYGVAGYREPRGFALCVSSSCYCPYMKSRLSVMGV